MQSFWINPILNVLALASITTGLYIAGRFLPALITWLGPILPGKLLSHRFSKIILWLALGTLFTSPLLDLVSFLAMLINTTLASQGGGEFSYLFGTVSPGIYSSFPLLLMVGVYGIILYAAREFLASSPQPQRTLRSFVVLALASLVFGGINAVFTQVLSFQIPFYIGQNLGAPGYLLEVLIGIGLFILILFGLNRLLQNHPASKP